MDSSNSINNFHICTNIHILIRSHLKIEFLHLLWKFHGYIFNGLEEK